MEFSPQVFSSIRESRRRGSNIDAFEKADEMGKALPWSDTPFRDRTYVAAYWINLNKLADMVAEPRCELGCIPFLDGSLTGNRTCRLPPPYISSL